MSRLNAVFDKSEGHAGQYRTSILHRTGAAGVAMRTGGHSRRARGIIAHLENGRLLQHAQVMAGYAIARTTKL